MIRKNWKVLDDWKESVADLGNRVGLKLTDAELSRLLAEALPNQVFETLQSAIAELQRRVIAAVKNDEPQIDLQKTGRILLEAAVYQTPTELVKRSFVSTLADLSGVSSRQINLYVAEDADYIRRAARLILWHMAIQLCTNSVDDNHDRHVPAFLMCATDSDKTEYCVCVTIASLAPAMVMEVITNRIIDREKFFADMDYPNRSLRKEDLSLNPSSIPIIEKAIYFEEPDAFWFAAIRQAMAEMAQSQICEESQAACV